MAPASLALARLFPLTCNEPAFDFTFPVVVFKRRHIIIIARFWMGVLNGRHDDRERRPDIQHSFWRVFSVCSKVADSGDVVTDMVHSVVSPPVMALAFHTRICTMQLRPTISYHYDTSRFSLRQRL